MVSLIVNWFLSALALWLIARFLDGFEVRDFGAALGAAAIIAIVNFFLGWLINLLALPLILVTLGLFLLVTNAILLKIASLFTPGFRIRGFVPALVGSVALTVLTWVLRRVVYA